jgi:hypothetical protein
LASTGSPSKLVADSSLKVYPGAPDGLFAAAPLKDPFNAYLLEFI